jgi:hypothetical protein
MLGCRSISIPVSWIILRISKAIPTYQRVASLIRDDLETRPLVAKRHYIETGNLRHFAVEYAPPADLPALLELLFRNPVVPYP